MAENSKIEWTTHTFNPWIGCAKVGPGCDNCYAENMMDTRLKRVQWGVHGTRKRTSPANWRKPLLWNEQAKGLDSRPRVFCASLADVFESKIDAIWRRDLWELIRETPNLDYLLLTKRIGNVPGLLPDDWGDGYPNVWLGATVVDQVEANRDIPKLLKIPSKVRFLSCEPMLGSIFLDQSIGLLGDICSRCDGWGGWGQGPDVEECGSCEGSGLDGDLLLHWVICGGESGKNARPLLRDWCHWLARDCYENEVAFFMKQGSQANWPDWKDFNSWPDAIRVREFPNVD